MPHCPADICGEYRHLCIDWDFMWIDETMCEILACECYSTEEFETIRETKREELTSWTPT